MAMEYKIHKTTYGYYIYRYKELGTNLSTWYKNVSKSEYRDWEKRQHQMKKAKVYYVEWDAISALVVARRRENLDSE